MRFRFACVLVVFVLLTISAFSVYIRSANTSAMGVPPVASFTYQPSIPMPSELIAFDASSSYDPDGSIVQYRWNFGDGSIATVTVPTVSYSYQVDGTYTVELVVTDNDGSTGVSSAVVEVSTVVYFRVCYYSTLLPIPEVEVTAYYNNGVAWVKAPVGPHGFEIKYDNMTQPHEANTAEEKYRNPGFTSSILRHDASNIGFDLHPSCWTVYFEFKYNGRVSYWPTNPTLVHIYHQGVVEIHNYLPGHQPHWDSSAGTYVIRVEDIPSNGVSPTESHPIIALTCCPPSPEKHYLTVRTDPTSVPAIPGEGWYSSGTEVSLSAPEYVNVSAGTRFSFSYWDVDGISQGVGVNSITVVMNSNHTATAHYVLQYLATFAQTGLSAHASGTVVNVDGVPTAYENLPYAVWVNNGDSITYSYASTVSSSETGERFRLDSVSGPTSPITVSSPVTVTGNYVAQYLVAFAQTGLDETASGTVVTVNGVTRTYDALPFSTWVDYGSSVSYIYASTVSSTVSDKRFRLDDVTGPNSPITVSSSLSVTGYYVTQYSVTFDQTGLDFTAAGTVVTVDGKAETYVDLKYVLWVDSGSIVTYSYNDIVLSTASGKKFKLVGVDGLVSPITVTTSASVTGNYVTQYLVTIDQTGVETDFAGTILTIDGVNYNYSGLPVSFWWNGNSAHSFSFASPLTVSYDKQYAWSSTSGLSNLKSGSLTVTTSGSLIGNYVVANRVTFDQTGMNSDFTGTIVIVDGSSYGFSSLPASFMWQVGSAHTFAFHSPLLIDASAKQYVWVSASGLSTLKAGSITVSTYGSIVGNYKTQYYLTLNTNPPGIASPSGGGWYDSGTYASISTSSTVGIVSGVSRYRFDGWMTSDMAEIVDPDSASTQVLMDKAKTVTADYVVQYAIAFGQSGVGSDFSGTVVSVDGADYAADALPVSFWWDSGSSHVFAFISPLVVNEGKQYIWTHTSGLSTLQSGSLQVTSAGSVAGNYAVQGKYEITFARSGIGSDFAGIVVRIDGIDYGVADLPVSFWWDSGSSHSFSYYSTLAVAANVKQYVWESTSGLSTARSGSIAVTSSGSITGNYKAQYYLILTTSPVGVTSPSGTGWYDANTNAEISTTAFVDIVAGSSRYRFNGWTTADMTELADPTRSPTTVLMDKAKTVTANYVIQYAVTFAQNGVSSDFSGAVLNVDGVDYTVDTLPFSPWFDKDSVHMFVFQTPLLVASDTKQYAWASTSGLSNQRADSIAITASGSIGGNYRTQYYLTVSSPYGSPTPASGWIDAGAQVTESVTSPWSNMSGVRHVCTGWIGVGSVPASGTATSVTFTMTQPSGITWNWKLKYLLTVVTDPVGLSVQPTRNPAGEAASASSWWYDVSTSVTLNAQPVSGHKFDYWMVDGTAHGNEVNPITVLLDVPHVAIAHYTATAPPLSLSITPTSASIHIGQAVTFTATVTGGTAPYSYQWYVNGNPVAGATSNSWIFTPTATGTYIVHVKVTEAGGGSAQSSPATVAVSPAIPVGGYSVSLSKIWSSQVAAYMALTVFFGAVLIVIRRKRK